MPVSFFYGKNEMGQRIGYQEQEGKCVRSPQHKMEETVFAHFMPGIREADDENDMQWGLCVMNQKISRMCKI